MKDIEGTSNACLMHSVTIAVRVLVCAIHGFPVSKNTLRGIPRRYHGVNNQIKQNMLLYRYLALLAFAVLFDGVHSFYLPGKAPVTFCEDPDICQVCQAD